MSKCVRAYKLDEAMQLYCHLQGNHSLRGLKGYVVTAKFVWQEIFSKTLLNYTKEWLPVYNGNPYPYVLIPEDVDLFMGLFDESSITKGKSALVQLDFDNSISTLPKPELKACSCTENCNCGDACAAANSFVREEIEHELDGETYIEYKWLETCKNGDVIEWREIPTKVYTRGVTSGEFSEEFSSEEFPTGEEYSIDVVTLQRRICTLKTKPCGCVDDSEYNKTLLKDYCSIDSTIRNYMFESCCVATRGKTSLRRDDENPRKIYIVGTIKKQYLLKSQRAGASENSLVPEYALMALWHGVEYYSAAFNPSVADKDSPKLRYADAKRDVIKYLNPITQRTLDYLQTTPKQM